jgi:hypothetical protein
MPPTHTITVTVSRAPGTDRYGDPTGPPATHEVSGCFFAPSSGTSGVAASTERTDLRDTVITVPTLFAPFGSDIKATDQILLPGDPKPWEVDGDVGDWMNPFSGWKPGQTISLRRVRG